MFTLKEAMARMALSKVSTIALTSFDALSSTTRKLFMESVACSILKKAWSLSEETFCADQRMIRAFPIRTRATLI